MLDLSKVFANFPILETTRYLLRATTPDDAPDIFKMMSDPRVMTPISQTPMTSLDEALRRVQMFARTFENENGVPWGIISRESGRLIGTCVYWNMVPENFRAEIGYMLASEAWGQGAATEAATAVLDYGFTTMGLHSVEAQIAPDNAASKRVLERLGFVQEGYFRENYYHPDQDRFSDTAVYSLLKSEWIKRKA